MAAAVDQLPNVGGPGPIPVEVEAGKTYYWCACGRSANQPFCDGSHKGTEFKPMAWKAEKTETKYFCACKATGNAPFCDGSHAKEAVVKRYNKQLLQANSELRDEVAALKEELAKLKA
eukprot:TRINITY_DN12373_c3_g2_i2.p1 TRINITY_DN12373_c3_g2~~TRINITY_DN12373_c3_g2_i2.p1  ORF type:complete len:118 (+),score=26.76 TRINITY_DN12373_c3_g2_i2:472-825(+)